MYGCFFDNNVGTIGGGVSLRTSEEAVKDDCSLAAKQNYFTNNIAQVGGAMFVSWPCNASLTDNYFLQNGGSIGNLINMGSGGAIYVQTVDRGKFDSEKALTNSAFEVRNSFFHHNFAFLPGGAIFTGCMSKIEDPIDLHPNCDIYLTKLTISDAVFNNNSAYKYGGGIAAYSNFDITRSVFTENFVVFRMGGAVFLYHILCNFTEIKLTNNTAPFTGNVIYPESSVIVVKRCLVTNSLQNDPLGVWSQGLDGKCSRI